MIATLSIHRIGRTAFESPRAADVASKFGLDPTPSAWSLEGPALPLDPGKIVLVLGPSGAGKSSILECLQGRYSTAIAVQRVAFPPEGAVIDAVAPGEPLEAAIEYLTSAGLSEPRLWIRRFAELSDGERFRAMLARALSIHAAGGESSGVPLLCDEFGSALHRRIAKAVAFNLRKLTTRRKLCVVVACSHPDIIDDLQPDALLRLDGAGRCSLEERHVRPALFSLHRRLRIEPAGKRDYAPFAAMHYRDADELGFVDKVFRLTDSSDGAVLGIVVYSHSPLELALRNRATNSYFSRHPQRVNRELRILRRLVIHPDVRGCGLGRFLVRRTLPLVSTPYVECLAAMGAYHPVFEKAGMERIGQYDLPPDRQVAVEALASLGIDTGALDFPRRVATDRRARAIVTRIVRRWYAGTTGGGESRVERQSPQFLARTFRGLISLRPVYYLWRRPIGKKGSGCKRTRSPRVARTHEHGLAAPDRATRTTGATRRIGRKPARRRGARRMNPSRQVRR